MVRLGTREIPPKKKQSVPNNLVQQVVEQTLTSEDSKEDSPQELNATGPATKGYTLTHYHGSGEWPRKEDYERNRGVNRVNSTSCVTLRVYSTGQPTTAREVPAWPPAAGPGGLLRCRLGETDRFRNRPRQRTLEHVRGEVLTRFIGIGI